MSLAQKIPEQTITMSPVAEKSDLFTRNTASFDYTRFQKPPAIDRPVPFLSWNEKMEPEEIRRQVDLIKEAGWGGAFVHSRIGLTTPYLGDEWFAAVDATVDQCRKQGIKVWLYDEDKWPSGYSGGTVPLADRRYRLQTLIARPLEMSIPPDCEPIGKPQDGLQMYMWTAPLGHDWFNGTCYTGLLNREAMRKYLDDAYESYYKRYSAEYGDTIVGEFTDEPCTVFRLRVPHGSLPYTPQLISRFQEMHGFDPTEKLHLMYKNNTGAAKFRVQYFRTVSTLFEENFTKQLADWCEDHGIGLTGHYMAEDTIFIQLAWATRIMPHYRHQHIPGIDHLRRHIGNTMTPKQCQSVVNQFGKPRMLSELYGVDGGSLSFEDRVWIAAEQMCLGVNLLNPHLSLYTMTGCRKRDYPQNMYYQQPWWPLNRLVDDPLSRVCTALSQGRYVPEVLLIHPMESAFALWQAPMDPDKIAGLVPWDHNPATDEAKAKIEELEQNFKQLISSLLGAQRTFDLGDEEIIRDAGSVAQPEGVPVFRVGEMQYRAVLLPTMVSIASPTLELLKEFVAAGGTVIRAGAAPTLVDGEMNDDLTHFFAKLPTTDENSVAEILAKSLPPLIRAEGIDKEVAEKLYAHIRDFEDGTRTIYLTNLHRTKESSSRVEFRGAYKGVWRLDTTTGEKQAVQSTRGKDSIAVELPFAPSETHLLLLDTKPVANGAKLTRGKIVDTVPVQASDWNVERLDENQITLDYAKWRLSADAAWSKNPTPVIGIQQYLNSRKYDGHLELQYSVRVDGMSPRRTVHLVVEYSDRYTVRVNGLEVRYNGLPAWRDFRWLPIDITGLLKTGENSIELRCDEFQHGDLACVEDSFARYGTEIESIYLTGDFSVSSKPTDEKPVAAHWSEYGLPPIAVQCFAGGSFSLSEPKTLRYEDTTVQGLPFYAGRISLKTKLPALQKGGQWSLAIDKLDAPVAEVLVDGEVVGNFMCHPLEARLPHATDAAGKEIEIRLYSTLRNLLGPHHHPEGELASVDPSCFWGAGKLDENGHNVWALQHVDGEPNSKWNDRYCMTTLCNLGNIAFIRRDD